MTGFSFSQATQGTPTATKREITEKESNLKTTDKVYFFYKDSEF